MKMMREIAGETDLSVSYAFGDLSIDTHGAPGVVLDFDSPKRCAPVLVTESGRIVMRPASGSYGLLDSVPRGRARLQLPAGHSWKKLAVEISSANLDLNGVAEAMDISATWSNLNLRIHTRKTFVNIDGVSVTATIYVDGGAGDGLRIGGVGMSVTVVVMDGMSVAVAESGMANRVAVPAHLSSRRGWPVELTGLRNRLEIKEGAYAAAV